MNTKLNFDLPIEKVIEFFPYGVAYLDLKGNFTLSNTAYQKMLGYSEDELKTMHFRDITPKQFAEKDKEIFEGLLSGESIKEYEKKNICKNGNHIPVKVSVTLIKNEKGEHNGFMAVVNTDIQKRYQDTQINLLKRFPQENPNPVIRISREGLITDVNPAGEIICKYWDKKRGEILPIKWKNKIIKVFETEISEEIELKIDDKLFNLYIQPIHGTAYVVIYGMDKTDQRDNTLMLFEPLEVVLEFFQEGLAIMGKNGNFIHTNRYFEDMLGYSQFELKTKSFMDVTPDYHNEASIKQFISLKDNQSFQGYEKEILKKNGKIIPVIISAMKVKIGTDDDIKYLAFIRHDSDKRIIELEKKYLKRFPELNPNMVVRVTNEGLIHDANESGKKICEYWESWVGHHIPDEWKTKIKHIMETQIEEEMDIEMDGKFCHLVLKPQPDSSFVIIYGIDVTDQRKAENELEILKKYIHENGLELPNV